MVALGFFIFLSVLVICDTWLIINGYDGVWSKRPKKLQESENER